MRLRFISKACLSRRFIGKKIGFLNLYRFEIFSYQIKFYLKLSFTLPFKNVKTKVQFAFASLAQVVQDIEALRARGRKESRDLSKYKYLFRANYCCILYSEMLFWFLLLYGFLY